MAILLLKSSTKYWLPAFSVKERQDGVFPGGAKPIAVSTPAYFVCTQHCAEPIPSLAGVCFQLVSTRWCAFTIGDLIAGAIGVVADAVVGAITNKFGTMIPGSGVGREVANALLGHGVNLAVGAMDAYGPQEGLPGPAGKVVRTLAGVAAIGAGNSQVATSMLAPLVGDFAEVGSNAVGEAYRERPPSGSGGSASSSPSGSGGSGGGSGSGGGGSSGSG
jgi:uncharacterized membrane protein YgcG